VIEVKSLDVTHDKKAFDLIKFVADGKILVIVSQNGTLISVISAEDATILAEVTRGWSKAQITSVSLR
jgi:hypothetical protein